MSLLKGTTVGELDAVANRKDLWTTTAAQNLDNVIADMVRCKISALPVWDSDKKAFIGEVDSRDVLMAVCLPYNESENDVAIVRNYGDGSIGDLMRLKYLPGTDTDLPDFGMAIFEPETSLQTVCKKLGTRHRCLVRQHRNLSGNTEHRMVTQTDLICFIHQNKQRLTGKQKAIMNEKLSNLGLAFYGRPISVPTSVSAADAFRVLHANRVTGVAVVESNGELVGNLSISDIRGLDPRKLLEKLNMPVIAFLKEVGTYAHPVTCRADSSLMEVMHQMVAAKIHRVWVTDSIQGVIGLVSMSDVLGGLATIDE